MSVCQLRHSSASLTDIPQAGTGSIWQIENRILQMSELRHHFMKSRVLQLTLHMFIGLSFVD